MTDIAGQLREMNSAFEGFKERYDERHDELRNHLKRIELAMNRPNMASGDDAVQNRRALNEALRAYARRGDDTALKNMSIGSDPDGGYLVPSLLSDTVLERSFDLSPLREYSKVIQIGTNSWQEPASIDLPGASWVSESAPRPVTTSPSIAMLEIFTREQYANVPVTQQLLEDSQFDIAAFLEGRIAEKFFIDEGAAIIAGDGVNSPRGILTYPIVSTADATRPWGSLQYIPTGAASDFVTPTTSVSPADCLIDTIYSMKSAHRTGARWYMNSLTAGKVRKFKDAQGRPIWTDTLIAGQPNLLLGYAVTTAEDLPAVGAGTFPILFANLNPGYSILDRIGVSVLRDPYTSKPNVLFYVRRRVGGAVSNSEAIKIVKCATS